MAEAIVEKVRARARPLRGEADLDPLIDRLGEARVVMLGEATHGTHEFYTWRAHITRRLLRERGFSFVAVEGDWPDCRRVDDYLVARRGASAWDVLHAFDRWPTWMWANGEMVELVEWMRAWNDERSSGLVRFHGLDVYSLRESLHALRAWLAARDGAALERAAQALRCFEPYGEDVQAYARATRLADESCEDEVVALLRAVRSLAMAGEDAFDAEQNALVAKNAEAYYRTMVRGGGRAWNERDAHMAETLHRLLRHHGPGSKAIVWAHNTHVGDARHTDMARGGLWNLGQLAREALGDEAVALVGFGSHRGTVIAADAWEAPMERMPLPPAIAGSWEEVLHRGIGGDGLLLFDREDDPDLLETRGHRAVGVVYHPAQESFGNYVPTVLPRRYDAFVHLDQTHALQPLHLPEREEREPPETWPSGF